MSRVAKVPVLIPAGVELKINGNTVLVTGPKGSHTLQIHPEVNVSLNTESDSNVVTFAPRSGSKSAKALAGTTRALINNCVVGVYTGFERKLELVGVGYRAQVKGSLLVLSLGFSHPVELEIPKEVTVETPSNTVILLKGHDKQQLGQFAANIRKYRKPEPYKGKGIKYAGEVIVRKEAKKK